MWLPTTDDAPDRRTLLRRLEDLCDEWEADAEKLSQTTGIEPTTLLRCKRDVEAILNGDDPTQ